MVVELQMKTSVAHPLAVHIHFHNFINKLKWMLLQMMQIVLFETSDNIYCILI